MMRSMRRSRKKKKRKDEVDIDRLDDYTSLLYEINIKRKVEGSKKIRRLVDNEKNWDFLISNVSLLNLLSRVLRNNGKESINLNFNILYFFYILSRVEEYQEVILSYGILTIILERIDYENGRYHRIIDRKVISEDLSRMVDFVRNQTKLLTVCLYLLLNLFGKIELNIEKLFSTLIGMLKRHSKGNHNHILTKCANEVEELLVVVIQLLLQLFQFENVITDSVDEEITNTLFDLINYPGDEVVSNVLRFFSVKLQSPKKVFIDRLSRMIPTFLKLVTKPKLHVDILKILYLLSKQKDYVKYFKVPITELKNKTGFQLIIGIIKVSPDERYIREELIAIGINLACDIGEDIKREEFDALQKKLFRTKDPLLCKMIRNLSQHDKIRPWLKHNQCIINFTKLFIMNFSKTNQRGLIVEILGILGNLVTVQDVSYRCMFSSKYRFEKYLNRCLRMDNIEDDILLEAVIVTGAILCKPDSHDIAKIMAKTHIIQKVSQIFVNRQEDEEFVLQSCYTIYSMLMYKETRSVFLQTENEECIDLIISHFDSQNIVVKRVVDLILDVISSTHEGFKKKIIKKKFEIHNAEWCAFISQEMGHPTGFQSSHQRSIRSSSNNGYGELGSSSNGYGGSMKEEADYINLVTNWGNEIRFDD